MPVPTAVPPNRAVAKTEELPPTIEYYFATDHPNQAGSGPSSQALHPLGVCDPSCNNLSRLSFPFDRFDGMSQRRE